MDAASFCCNIWTLERDLTVPGAVERIACVLLADAFPPEADQGVATLLLAQLGAAEDGADAGAGVGAGAGAGAAVGAATGAGAFEFQAIAGFAQLGAAEDGAGAAAEVEALDHEA